MQYAKECKEPDGIHAIAGILVVIGQNGSAMRDDLRELNDRRHPDHPKPIGFYLVRWSAAAIILGISTVIALDWHDYMVFNVALNNRLEGAREGRQPVDASIVCLAKVRELEDILQR